MHAYWYIFYGFPWDISLKILSVANYVDLKLISKQDFGKQPKLLLLGFFLQNVQNLHDRETLSKLRFYFWLRKLFSQSYCPCKLIKCFKKSTKLKVVSRFRFLSVIKAHRSLPKRKVFFSFLSHSLSIALHILTARDWRDWHTHVKTWRLFYGLRGRSSLSRKQVTVTYHFFPCFKMGNNFFLTNSQCNKKQSTVKWI